MVKLGPAGKLLWYYQLTPHDLYDWDLQDPPVLTTANGQPVVIDGGKAGILTELDAQTGKLIWQRPVGGHDGHETDGLLTEHATPTSHGLLPAHYCLEPSLYGGILTQLASNGFTTFAAVNDLALPATPAGYSGSPYRASRPSRTPWARWSRSTRTPALSSGTPRFLPRRTAPRR